MRKAPSRFTWRSDSPAPFESSWMIFAKIIALNYLKPHVVWDEIATQPSEERKRKKLSLHQSEWINFDRFSDSLGVKVNRLKKGFLDQLGFAVSSTDIAKGIRFCPDCLAKGFHCTYFNLSLIEACPWHGAKLLPACKECVQLMVSGLTRENWVERHFHPDRSDIDADIIYKSKCGHLSFIPHLSNSINHFSEDEQSGVNVACNLMLRWWYMINSSIHPYALFAQKLFDQKLSDEELKKSLSIAKEIAGECPWPLRLTDAPAGRCEWRQTVSQSNINNDEMQDYLVGIYKSIRRHIFRRILRHHRDCVLFLLELNEYEAQKMISSTTCSFALAFAWWRMLLEKNNLLLNSRRIQSPLRLNTELSIGLQDSKLIQNPKSLAHIWYIQFFVILDIIESKIDKVSFDISRWEILSYQVPKQANFEFVPDTLSSSELANGRWLVLYPEAKNLMVKADQRCEFKFDESTFTEEMYSIHNISLLKFRRAGHVQFRIINLSEQRKNFLKSYAAMDGHFYEFNEEE